MNDIIIMVTNVPTVAAVIFVTRLPFDFPVTMAIFVTRLQFTWLLKLPLISGWYGHANLAEVFSSAGISYFV